MPHGAACLVIMSGPTEGAYPSRWAPSAGSDRDLERVEGRLSLAEGVAYLGVRDGDAAGLPPDPPTELRFATAGALPDASAVVGPRVIHRLELAGSAVDTPASERRPGRVASLLVRQGLCGLLAVVGGDQGDALVWIGPVADLKFGGVPAGQGDGVVAEVLHPLIDDLEVGEAEGRLRRRLCRLAG